MNCHGNNKNKQNSHNHSPLKHMLHMVICCGLPLILVGLLPAISRLSPSASLENKISHYFRQVAKINWIC